MCWERRRPRLQATLVDYMVRRAGEDSCALSIATLLAIVGSSNG
jgi:hypothetical protein